METEDGRLVVDGGGCGFALLASILCWVALIGMFWWIVEH